MNIITNADQGVLVSWELQTASYSPGWGPTSTTYYIAAVSGGSLMAQGPTNQLVQPVLQAQDGSFYGTTYAGGAGGIIKFDQSGNIQWSVPGDSPKIATADGGVIGASGITYDSNGNATDQIGLPIQSWTGNGYTDGPVDQVVFTPTAYATSFAPVNGGNPSAVKSPSQNGPYVQSLGSTYRARVANIAKGYVGDSTDWNEASNGGNTTCNLFVRDVLIKTSNDIQPDIPYPVRPNLSWYQSNFRHPFLAADWANSNQDGGCWKVLPAGPDGALPGDVIATGWPANGNDGTGHVGIVVKPNSGAPNYKDASAADYAPYWWPPAQKQSFIPGTITLTDYGFRLPGFDPTNPQGDVQGLKQDSHVRRFMCY